MTTPPTNGPEPADDDLDGELSPDELAVHAVLDGEATSDQRHLVSTRPDLLADLEALGGVRDLLAEPPPALSPAVVDTHVARALDAMDGPTSTDPARGPATSARPAGRRHRRPRHDRPGHWRPTSWLVAAAVVLVVALGAVTVANLTGEPADDTASVARDADPAGDEPANAVPEGGAPASTAEAAAADGAVRAPGPVRADLGEVAGLDELLTVARQALQEAETGGLAEDDGDLSAPEAASPPSTSTCEAAEPTADGTALVADAVLDGRRVIVVVTTAGDGGPDTIRVRTTDDCALVFVGRL